MPDITLTIRAYAPIGAISPRLYGFDRAIRPNYEAQFFGVDGVAEETKTVRIEEFHLELPLHHVRRFLDSREHFGGIRLYPKLV